jgi:D-3-phosphoglycerate dehydrogenase
MKRVLICTEAIREMPGPHLDRLHAAGFEEAYPSQVQLFTEAETIRELTGFDAVIASGEPYTDRVMAALPQLRVISRNGVGYDRVDTAAATRHGLPVTITPTANHEAVAEQAFAMMLAVARQVVSGANDCRAGHWRRRKVFIPLRGSTLGIVGLGRIGCSVASRAKAFKMRVIAYDLFPNRAFADQCGIELVDLETLYRESDFVSLHAPSTPETIDMINRRSLALMKPGSVLINAARGSLVNEDDLLEALNSGHLAGAALDVFKVEPPPADHPLLAHENVVASAHLASFDTQAREDMAVAAAQNIIDLMNGVWPEGSVVNPEVRGRMRLD